jgi:hypothetical protein
MLDSNAPEIKTKKQLKDYLREWAKGWTGSGVLVIESISDSYINKNMESLSDDIGGQRIEFNCGKVTFKRKQEQESPDERIKKVLGLDIKHSYVAKRVDIPARTFSGWATTQEARFDAICWLVAIADEYAKLVNDIEILRGDV